MNTVQPLASCTGSKNGAAAVGDGRGAQGSFFSNLTVLARSCDVASPAPPRPTPAPNTLLVPQAWQTKAEARTMSDSDDDGPYVFDMREFDKACGKAGGGCKENYVALSAVYVNVDRISREVGSLRREMAMLKG